MKTISTIIGTQGDIELFSAIGRILKKEGHHILSIHDSVNKIELFTI